MMVRRFCLFSFQPAAGMESGKRTSFPFLMAKLCSILSAIIAVVNFNSQQCTAYADDDDALQQANKAKTSISFVRAVDLISRYADDTLARSSDADLAEFRGLLSPIMARRVPGTAAHTAVRKHIADTLKSYGFSTVWEHKSKSRVPVMDMNIHGQEMEFVNIVATFDPDEPSVGTMRKLVFACHYDSKYFHAFSKFVGATDSAVPCAMLLDMARRLSPLLEKRKTSGATPSVTLQLVFFDGEEAFKQWSDTDSLYGSRSLAQHWDSTGDLTKIDLFVLLDLLGTEMGHCSKNTKAMDASSRQLTLAVAGFLQTVLNRCPRISSYMPDTQAFFDKMLDIQAHLKTRGLYVDHMAGKRGASTSFGYNYLESRSQHGVVIADDHLPFQQRGVKIVHIIPYPFPVTWHTDFDKEDSLHWPTIQNLNAIFRLAAADYLDLQ